MDKKALRLKLAKILLSFATVETDKGVLSLEGELEVGTELYVEDENGEMIPATDGEYVINEDGRTIVVADGKVTEIREKPIEEETGTTEEHLEEETPATPNYEEAINTLLAAVEELTAEVENLKADMEVIKEDLQPKIEDEFSDDKKKNKPVWDRM